MGMDMGVTATGDAGGGLADRQPTSFATYEDYLDSQVSPLDLFYLEDEDLARQLVELGHTGYGDTLKREEFEARKKAEHEKHQHRESAPKPLASMGKDLTGKPLLQALASREELLRNGKLSVRERNRRRAVRASACPRPSAPPRPHPPHPPHLFSRADDPVHPGPQLAGPGD
jgi:Domain of unknown function (DUF4464)